LLWPSILNDDPTAQDPRTIHEARAVVSGVKYGANAWIHLYDFQKPNLWGCTGSFDQL
jgi:prolyl 4-hydroxylase